MNRKSKLTGAISAVLGVSVILLTIACIIIRVQTLISANNDSLSAFSNKVALKGENTSEKNKTEEEMQTEAQSQTETEADTEQTSEIAQTPSDDETLYPVIETHIGEGSTVYSNFSVKNTTDHTINFDDLLSRPLPFSILDTHEVQVLIVHTHACECYLSEDTGYYSSDYYPRTTDNSKNVTQVGESIMASLKKEGIGVVHCLTQHDNPSYDGSYNRSLQSIEYYLEKYPNISVILDIHRDSIGKGGPDGKIKPTFTYDEKKAAQIMIMSGYDSDGSMDYPDWEENLVFALKLQQTAEEMFPGMTRPLYFGNFVYNLNVNNGSLLIEVGTDANTLDEAVYTGELLGKVLARVLKNKQ